MAYNNRRNSYSSNNKGYGRNSRTSNKRGGGGFKNKGDFNMMTFGVGFFDEDGKYPKVRILLKSDNANKPPVDEEGNEYTREEAAQLLAKALLEGRGISLYLFENEDGGMSGNARIDINGLDVEEEQPKRKAKPARREEEEDERPVRKTTKAKPRYVAPEPDEDEEDEDEEEVVVVKKVKKAPATATKKAPAKPVVVVEEDEEDETDDSSDDEDYNDADDDDYGVPY